MSDSSNKQPAKLPIVFGALLQTGAGMALLGSAAIASEPKPQTILETAPKLVSQPDGSVTTASSPPAMAAQTSLVETEDQTKSQWKLVVAEDGTVSIEPIAEDVSNEVVTELETDETSETIIPDETEMMLEPINPGTEGLYEGGYVS
ncbi:MAG: hypothetical protein WA885_18840 [Phormidesmis sp.]